MKLPAAAIGLALAACVSAFAPQRTAFRPATELFERKPFITGNWKLNPSTKQDAIALATAVANAVTQETPGDVAIFVPFVFLEAAQICVGSKFAVGAEVRVEFVGVVKRYIY
jgi:triosephosphate isomerase